MAARVLPHSSLFHVPSNLSNLGSMDAFEFDMFDGVDPFSADQLTPHTSEIDQSEYVEMEWESDSHVSDQVAITDSEQKPKRKRIRKRVYVPPKPRILKSDIRRQYTLMFINVLNSQDMSMFRSFFQTYGGAVVAMRKNINGLTPVSADMNPNNALLSLDYSNYSYDFQLTGLDLVAAYWAAFSAVTPDRISRINDATIKVRSDDIETVLTTNFHVWFTRVYYFDPVSAAQEIQQVYRHRSDSSGDNNNNSSNSDNSAAGNKRTFEDTFQQPDAKPTGDVLHDEALWHDIVYRAASPRTILPMPREVCLRCKMVMKANALHQIVSFDIEGWADNVTRY